MCERKQDEADVSAVVDAIISNLADHMADWRNRPCSAGLAGREVPVNEQTAREHAVGVVWKIDDCLDERAGAWPVLSEEEREALRRYPEIFRVALGSLSRRAARSTEVMDSNGALLRSAILSE